MGQWQEGLVSIVTPVYNAEHFLAETIESVQAQSYSNWELLLVNDASSDASQALIEDYMAHDDRIRLINLSENSGAAVARNTGLATAMGQYIAFIDADDVWLATKLENQLAFMQELNYSFSYTNFALIDERGQLIKKGVKLPESLDYHGLLKNTAIACSTVVIDRRALGDFRMPEVRKGQDTATWLMLMRERGVRAYGLNQVLNLYRQVQGSISSDRLGALKRTWNTYRNLEQLPLYQAVYYFIQYVWNAVKRRL